MYYEKCKRWLYSSNLFSFQLWKQKKKQHPIYLLFIWSLFFTLILCSICIFKTFHGIWLYSFSFSSELHQRAVWQYQVCKPCCRNDQILEHTLLQRHWQNDAAGGTTVWYTGGIYIGRKYTVILIIAFYLISLINIII